MGRSRALVTGLALGALLVGSIAAASPAGAALQKACTVLEPSDIEAVVGLPIGEPDGAGSKAGCSFDIGDGIGSPDGGLVVTQYQKGKIAKNLWTYATQHQERAGALYWDPESGIASGFKKGKLFAASVTITGTDDAEHRDAALALVAEGLQNL